MMADLRPCPNCGSTELKHCYVFVKCTKCLMEGPKTNGGLNDDHADHMDSKWATENWNDLPRRDDEYFLLQRFGASAGDTDIIGIVNDEDHAKSIVKDLWFCKYEKVKLIRK